MARVRGGQRSRCAVLREERLAPGRHGRQSRRYVERPVAAGSVALRETADALDLSTLRLAQTSKPDGAARTHVELAVVPSFVHSRGARVTRMAGEAGRSRDSAGAADARSSLQTSRDDVGATAKWYLMQKAAPKWLVYRGRCRCCCLRVCGARWPKLHFCRREVLLCEEQPC